MSDMTKDAFYSSILDEVNMAKDEPLDSLGGKTPRDLLVFLGEGIKHEFNPRFFVDKLIKDMEQEDIFDLYIIDDLRFPVEVDALREKFGNDLILVYIHSDDALAYLCEGLIDRHLCDWYALNNGTLGELYDEATDIVEKMVLHNE